VIDADGNWVYTLDNDSDAVQSLGEGVSAEETFAVISSDGSETQFVTITVQGVNDVPTVTGTTTGAAIEDGTQLVTGTITVDDPDAGESSVQPLSDVAGTYGTFSILANGNWTYILDNADPAVQALAEGETVTDSFTVTSFDGTVTETVTVTVTGTNDVPTVTGTTTGAVVEDGTQVATGTIAVDDPDNGESSVQPLSDVAGTYGTFSILANGNWTYILDNAHTGVQALAEGETVTDSFTVTSFDGTVTEMVTVTVTGTNDVPTVTGTTTGAVVEDGTQVATGTIAVDDPDNGESSVQPLSDVAGTYGTFSILANGNWTYILDNADPAVQALAQGEMVTDIFTVTSFDGTVTVPVTVTITGTNDAPVAQDDEFVTNENTAVNGNVLADNGNGPDDDVDGDPLTVTHVNGSTANVGTQIVLASGALLLLNADGSFAYDPNGQFEELGAGDSAQDSFTYTVADGQGGSDTATVTLTINGVNEAPVATDSLIATNEGVAASGMLTGMDVNPGDSLTFSLEQGPQNGTVVINADGSYVYTPDEGVTGQDSFTFRVTDGQDAFDIATVEIDIAEVGELAVPKDITGTDGNDVLVGSALNDVLSGGLGNDVLRSGGTPQNFFGTEDFLDGAAATTR
jgi:VCBS repeat-containing protein